MGVVVYFHGPLKALVFGLFQRKKYIVYASSSEVTPGALFPQGRDPG